MIAGTTIFPSVVSGPVGWVFGLTSLGPRPGENILTYLTSLGTDYLIASPAAFIQSKLGNVAAKRAFATYQSAMMVCVTSTPSLVALASRNWLGSCSTASLRKGMLITQQGGYGQAAVASIVRAGTVVVGGFRIFGAASEDTDEDQSRD
jgi:hypothetical protein